MYKSAAHASAGSRAAHGTFHGVPCEAVDTATEAIREPQIPIAIFPDPVPLIPEFFLLL